MVSIGANINQRSSIGIVVIDADNLASIVGCRALDVHITLALAVAVTTRSIDFSVVLSIEVDDVNGTAAVVLDNLIRGVVGAAANDPRFLALGVSFLRSC
jgi:hypothetical protein